MAKQKKKKRKTRVKRRRITQIIMMLIMMNAFVLSCMAFELPPFGHKPTIALEGEDVITLHPGDKYVEPGYIAKTHNGDDITGDVVISSDWDYANGYINTDEDRTITYSVEYKSQKQEVTRKVVVEHAKPKHKKEDKHGIPICMYHYVYDDLDPPEDLNNNYVSTADLESHLEYLEENKFYFPSWEELRDYIDGKIDLPENSVVLTFDDGANSFLKLGVPLLEEHDVRATSFVICEKNGEDIMRNYANLKHVEFQSHSYGMHTGGGEIGHGGIMTSLTVEEAEQDLKKSMEVLGNDGAFAYPYGDTNSTSRKAVSNVGFKCAVTTTEGKVYPGDDPLALNRIRISLGMNQDGFAYLMSQDYM